MYVRTACVRIEGQSIADVRRLLVGLVLLGLVGNNFDFFIGWFMLYFNVSRHTKSGCDIALISRKFSDVFIGCFMASL